jgi:hypothetical protein
VALCQARISTKPLWGFSSSNPYHSQSRAEQLLTGHYNVTPLEFLHLLKSENPIYVFPRNETAQLRSLFLHSGICELFIIPRIGLPICLQQNRQTDPGNI